ncbi:probable G-protein coupled receptor 139 [Heptranchias perlo]|uniref:probable G-protein coupled receptor 139 n=1 Tax=Heptranchias perlo TaxID=212740 RepID=UPI00355A5AC5
MTNDTETKMKQKKEAYDKWKVHKTVENLAEYRKVSWSRVSSVKSPHHFSDRMRVPLTAYPFTLLPPVIQTVMIYYPIIAAIGVPANVTTIVILSRRKCGLSKCVTRYLVAMAVADLLVIINDVVMFRIKDYYFPTNFLFLTPVCSLQTALNHAVSDISVWLTVAFTFDRFVTICYQKLRTKYCTEKTAAAVIGTLCPLFCLKNIPWYFAFEPSIILDNVPWDCGVKPDFYTSAAWVAFTWIHRCLTPLLPILLVLLLNSMTVANIVAANGARRRLRGSKRDANQNDPEMKNRRKSITILFAISGNFILLWMTYVLLFLSLQITNRYYSTGFNDPTFIADQTSYMLLLLSCCTNTCIYAVTQTKFREELKNGVKYPLKLIFKSVKRGQ